MLFGGSAGAINQMQKNSQHRRTNAFIVDNYASRDSVDIDCWRRGSFNVTVKRASDLTFFRNSMRCADRGRIPDLAAKENEFRSTLRTSFLHLQDRLKVAIQELHIDAVTPEQQIARLADKIDNLQDTTTLKAVADESTFNLDSNKMSFIKSKAKFNIQASKVYYIGELLKMDNDHRRLEHLSMSIEYFKKYQHLDTSEEPEVLNRHKISKGKKVLVVDLDQTLISCNDQRMTPNDIELSLEEGEEDSMKTYFISVRPYAISFLKHMSELYEIVAFTASLRSYADSVLDELDPDRSLIRHRVYRDSCTKLPKKLYGKDLRVLGCNLKDVVLVDNSPYSLPILSYTASEDQELLGLEKYLRQLAGWHDIRECNRRTFKLSEYTTFSDPFDLISQLYLTADFSHLKGAGWNRFRGK